MEEFSDREYEEAALDTRIGEIMRRNLSEITEAITKHLQKRMLAACAIRERFLGKAEKERKYYAGDDMPDNGFVRPYNCFPELRHYISIDIPNTHSREKLLAAFRDEDTRDRVLAFLNEADDA